MAAASPEEDPFAIIEEMDQLLHNEIKEISEAMKQGDQGKEWDSLVRKM